MVSYVLLNDKLNGIRQKMANIFNPSRFLFPPEDEKKFLCVNDAMNPSDDGKLQTKKGYISY